MQRVSSETRMTAKAGLYLLSLLALLWPVWDEHNVTSHMFKNSEVRQTARYRSVLQVHS